MRKTDTESLRFFMNQAVPIPDDAWNVFESNLEYIEYEKYETILQSGEVENYLYFLIDGVTRIFYSDSKAEYTLRFNFPIAAFNSYTSYISRTPSLISVEALTLVKAYRVSYKNMEKLYSNVGIADRMGRKLLELLYVSREMKEIHMHSKTAEENYLDLVNSNDDLIQLIPQKHIASYLGIAPESLSRIRRNLVKP